MTINSKKKGSAGERELAKKLRDLGFGDVRRTVQYNGRVEEGDPDLLGIKGVHIECKRVERLNIDNAMAQAMRDAKEDETPMVFHRKNGKPWLVTMTIADWARREHVYLKEREDGIS